MPTLSKHTWTIFLVVLALALVAWRYWDYLANPWTRDGMVRANVIQVTPRVSGPIVELPIEDNQAVRAGELLFRIDPRTFQTALDGAGAQLDTTRDHLRELEEQVRAAEAQLEQAESMIAQAQFAIESAEAHAVRTAADYARAVDLIDRGDISKRDYDLSYADNETARADLQSARSNLAESRAFEVQTRAQLAAAKAELGAPGEDNAQLRAAKADLE
ncbi:MAG: HlyD family secretion protein, partial [Planctomycetota bacterium]